MIYVVGGRGFVGSAFVRLCERLAFEHRVITRQNYEDYRDTACDILINADGNSKKYLSDNEPMADFDMSVRSVADTLVAFRAETYVLFSTGDVYPDQSTPEVTREDQSIDVNNLSRYGLHNFLAECLVQGIHPNWLIIRAGGLVGPGLKKNAIFDMLTDGPVWLTPNSELQFLSTDAAATIVWGLLEKTVRNEVVNLGGLGQVRLQDVHDLIGSRSSFKKDARQINYELNLEKLQSLVDVPISESIAEVEAFIARWRPEEKGH